MVASPSTVPAPPPVTPDPEQLLQAAVRQRDPAAADRLLQQWVHRRGLAALEEFLVRLAISQGEEARHWLDERIQAPTATATPATPQLSGSVQAAAPAAVEVIEVIEGSTQLELPEGNGAPPESSAPDPEQPPAAVPPVLSAPAPAAPLDPVPAAAAADTDPDPAAEPASTGSVAAGGDFTLEWNFDFDAAFPPLGGGTAPVAGDPADEADPAEVADPVLEDAPRSSRRGPLARMRSLVRDYLGEAKQALRGGQEQDGGPEPEREFAGEEPAGTTAAGPATEEPIWSPPSEEIAGRPAATSLPELPEIDAPAPAAPALSDLRSWLPGGEDELPRAS